MSLASVFRPNLQEARVSNKVEYGEEESINIEEDSASENDKPRDSVMMNPTLNFGLSTKSVALNKNEYSQT